MLFRISLVAACCMLLAGCATMQDSSTRLEVVASRPSDDRAAPVTPAPASPQGSDFIEERAMHAYATGRWDVAEGYYLQLTRLRPREADPWFQLGNLYAEQGRLDAAERAYRESLRRRDDARALHNLGLVQLRLGAGALREAWERLPPDDPARQQTREFLRTLLEAMAR